MSNPNVGTRPISLTGTASGQLQCGSWELIDADWWRGVAAEQNNTYQSGITAAVNGGAQAAATQIQPGYAFNSVDTSTGSGTDSVMLYPAHPGHRVNVYNNTANTIYVYANSGWNTMTKKLASDTIKNSSNATQFSLTTLKSVEFFCITSGQWAVNLTA